MTLWLTFHYILNPGLGREVVNAALLHFLAAKNTVEHTRYGSQLQFFSTRYTLDSQGLASTGFPVLMGNFSRAYKKSHHGNRTASQEQSSISGLGYFEILSFIDHAFVVIMPSDLTLFTTYPGVYISLLQKGN